MASEKLKEVRALVAHLKELRRDREPIWKEQAKWLIPHRGVFDGMDHATLHKERTRDVYNNAPARSVRRAATGITNGLVPQSAPWFRMVFRDWAIAERSGRRAYLDAVEEALYAQLRAAGFYQAIHSAHEEAVGFGCCLLFQDSGVNSVMRFECVTCGTYAVGLDADGMLDAVARDIKWSARQLAQKFGKERLSANTRSALEKSPYTPVDVVHVVRPRAQRDAQRIDARNMPYESVFYEANVTDGDVLHEGGFHEMPYHFSTFNKGISTYGTGPGDDMLPDAKQMQMVEADKLYGLKAVMKPPMKVPTSFKDRLDMRPGAKNPVPPGQGDSIGPLVQVRPEIQQAREEITTLTYRIDDTTMASLFGDVSMENRPQGMTASEWLGRQRERLQHIGPFITAHETGLLTPVLIRTHGMLDRAGMLPVPPQDMEEVAIIDIEYISPLAQAMRQTKADTTRAFVRDVLEISTGTQDASVLDKVDFDQAVDELAAGQGVPARIVRSDEDVAALREQRAAAQQKQEQAAQSMAAMQALSRAAATPTGPDTLAGDMMGKEAANAQ